MKKGAFTAKIGVQIRTNLASHSVGAGRIKRAYSTPKIGIQVEHNTVLSISSSITALIMYCCMPESELNVLV